MGLLDCLDTFLTDGVECKEDLRHIREEDLRELGLNKVKARKAAEAFAGIDGYPGKTKIKTKILIEVSYFHHQCINASSIFPSICVFIC